MAGEAPVEPDGYRWYGHVGPVGRVALAAPGIEVLLGHDRTAAVGYG